MEIPTLSINNESLLCCDSCDSTCLPSVLQIALTRPQLLSQQQRLLCDSVLHCLHQHTLTHPHLLTDLPLPLPRCTDLATSLCYGRLSHHSHIPNVFFPSKAVSEVSVAVAAFKAEWQNRGQGCRDLYMLTGHSQHLRWTRYTPERI